MALPIGYMLVAGLIGYLLGSRDGNRTAADACDLAGKTILLLEEYKERLEEYERDED